MKHELVTMPDGMITIPLERYNELIRKEMVFEIKKRETLMNNYATANEKALFEAMGSCHCASEEVE